MITANEIGRPVRRGLTARPVRAGRAFRQGSRQLLSSLAVASLCVFVFSIPLENALVLPGIGTLGRIIGLVACAIGLLAVIEQGKVRAVSLPMILMAVYVAWASLTYFWSAYPQGSIDIVESYMQLLVMVWLIWQLAPKRHRQVLLMQAYLVGTALSAVGTLFLTMHNGMSVREGGFNMNPNDVGLRLAMSFPMAIYLGARENSTIKSWMYRLHMVLCASAIFSTASRGALLAFCAAGLMIPMTFRHWKAKQRVAMVAVAIFGFVVAGALVPRAAWERLSTTGTEVSSGTMDSRTVIWHAGMDVFLDHPFIGVGIGGFASSVERRVVTPWVAHNTFLSVLVEQGIVGFSFFLIVLLALAYAAAHMPPLERSLWLVTLLIWAIGVSAMTWEFFKPTWFMFGMIVTQAASFPLTSRISFRSIFAQRRAAHLSRVPEHVTSVEQARMSQDLHVKLQHAGIELPESKQESGPR
jgi:O-antigen ligase